MNYRPLFLAAIAAGFVANTANAGVVYSNDFQNANANINLVNGTIAVSGTNLYDSGANNRATLTDASGTGTSTWLGRIASGSATLNLSNLVANTTYSLQFDLYIGGSWDGNTPTGSTPNGANIGPDVIKVTASAATILNATFSNMFPTDFGVANNLAGQTYTDSQYLSGAAPVNGGNIDPALNQNPGTGADVKNYSTQTIYDRYAIYYFGHGVGNPILTFTPTSTSISLAFTDLGLEAPNQDGTPNEFWALDNVKISSADSPAVVPVPGNLVLLGSVALVGFVGRTVRRIRKS